MFLSGECNLLGSVSSHQKFEATDIKILSTSPLLDILCYSSRFLNRPSYSYQVSITALCYSSVLFRKQQENISSRHEGMSTQRHEEKRECPSPMAPLYMFFPCPGPDLCKLGQPGVLFGLPEVLTPVLRPSFVVFSWDFPFLSFQFSSVTQSCPTL